MISFADGLEKTERYRDLWFLRIAYISESLGHNDLKTTESYLASFEKEEREKKASQLTNFNKE